VKIYTRLPCGFRSQWTNGEPICGKKKRHPQLKDQVPYVKYE